MRNKKPSVNNFILIYKNNFTEENLKQRIERTRNNRGFVIFNKNHQYIGTWTNQTACGNDLGVYRGSISKCLTGVLNKTHNYYFYYLEDCCPNEFKTLIAQ